VNSKETETPVDDYRDQQKEGEQKNRFAEDLLERTPDESHDIQKQYQQISDPNLWKTFAGHLLAYLPHFAFSIGYR
jgi:hypothetical protein